MDGGARRGRVMWDIGGSGSSPRRLAARRGGSGISGLLVLVGLLWFVVSQ
jgi:hypothetical protein